MAIPTVNLIPSQKPSWDGLKNNVLDYRGLLGRDFESSIAHVTGM